MTGYIIRRLLIAIPTILVIITVAFFMMRYAPGGPFDLERPMPAEVRQNMLAAYGMDQPVWKQYLDYLAGLAQFDLGPSLKFRDKTVSDILSEGFPVLATIGLLSISLALFIPINSSFEYFRCLRKDSLKKVRLPARSTS